MQISASDIEYWTTQEFFPNSADDIDSPSMGRVSTTGADMLIAILNQSTLVSDDDAATMTQAIAAQIRLDVAPLWDRTRRIMQTEALFAQASA